ncbi:MAG TPA: hypothetical protein VG407_00775 [Caulobacteraceae bacterium]|jgi:hypothetical protein|nr:hypothetical protein [Caulobacteraceae bacterium]
MAELKVIRNGNQRSLSVTWDVRAVLGVIEKMAETQSNPRRGFVVAGRRIDEYAGAVEVALSSAQPVKIHSFEDLRFFVGQNTHIPENLSDAFLTLFRRLPDWALDRFNVACRNGSLGDWDYADFSNELFRHEAPPFSDPDQLRKLVSHLAKGFSGRLVCMHELKLGHTHIHALIPLIAKESEDSAWIFFSSGGYYEAMGLPNIQREYLTHANMVELIAEETKATLDSVDRAITKRASYVYKHELMRSGMTFDQFKENFFELMEVISRADVVKLPDVPRPSNAPFRFYVFHDQLALADDGRDGVIQESLLREVIGELRELINDVLEHHNLSNSSPILNSKIARLGSKLDAIEREGISSPKIVTFGMLASTVKEVLDYESENLFPPAIGAVGGVIEQSLIFINRFDVWRTYVRDSAGYDTVFQSGRVVEVAAGLLRDCASSPGVLATVDQPAITDFIKEISEPGTGVAEAKGLLATVQNMLAVTSTHVRDFLARTAGNFEKAAIRSLLVGGGHILAHFLVSEESPLRILAREMPVVFGWLNSLLDWISALGK